MQSFSIAGIEHICTSRRSYSKPKLPNSETRTHATEMSARTFSSKTFVTVKICGDSQVFSHVMTYGRRRSQLAATFRVQVRTDLFQDVADSRVPGVGPCVQ